MGAFYGTGATITFGTSSYTAEITSITPFSGVREPLETTHLGTTVAKEFIPACLIDWGDLVVELNVDFDNEPPLDQPVETITIALPVKTPPGTPGTLVGQGFMTAFDATIPLEELMTASFTIKWSGDVVWTDEA